MYTGHVGIALAAKGLRVGRDVPLWLLLLASVSPDLISVGLAIAGPGDAAGMRSHSIPAIVAAALAHFLIASFMGFQRGPASLVALVALSHVAVDYITSELPSWPGGPVLGWGLYRVPAADLAMEALLVGGGWLLYRRSLSSSARSSPLVLVILLALLLCQGMFDVLFAAAAAG